MPAAPRLLVLAASTYQLPFIAAARRLGSFVLTVDNRPSNPGHRMADLSIDCDTTDPHALLSIAREHAVDGVVAAATDVALDAAALIASELGLPGPSPDCTRALTRKIGFRALQERLGLPMPRYAPSLDDLHFPGPWIVKPNRASGSKGIRIVGAADELPAAWKAAEAESVDGLALVEAFIPGHQCTLEGVLQDGRVVASLATDRLTAPAPAVGTCGHVAPGDVPRHILAELHGQVQRIFQPLGYAQGPFDADFVIDARARPVLLELAPRAGGNSLVQLLRHACGFEMPDYVVRTALGLPFSVVPFSVRPTILEILAADRDGRLSYDAEALATVRSMPGVCHLEFDYAPGVRVQRFVDGRDRIGELVVSAATRDEAQALLSRARDALRIQVD